MRILLVLVLGLAACTGNPVLSVPSSEAVASPTPSELSPIVSTAAPSPPAIAVAPPVSEPSLTLLGHTDLGGRGFNGNVRVLGSYAYVGSWGSGGLCPALGVRIIDLSDPTTPRPVATAARIPGTSAEDVVPVRMSTSAFTGDLLAVGIQRCARTGSAPGGLALVDITDPRNPVDLGFFSTGPGPGGVHELDVTVRDGRAFALLAVPYAERYGAGDLRIVDITDPRHPVEVGSWGVGRTLGITTGVGCTSIVYAHSARAGQGGMRAYVSYMDAGLIVLDITDPTAPQLVARLFVPGEEGTIHSADETPFGLLLVTDENDVFRSPRALRLSVEMGGKTEEFDACEAESGNGIDQAGMVSGALVEGGTLCAPGAALPAGAVVVADQAGCSLSTKARQARAVGARALILVAPDELSAPRTESGGAAGLPVLGVSAETGARLRELARVGATVTVPAARPWGGLAVWDISDPARPVRRAYFRTVNARRFPPPGPGYFTAHNPVSAGRYALVSWYADGVRLIDLADPDNPREVAAFVPPPAPDPQGFFPAAAEVWGVALAGDLVLASDINTGLYVLRVTGLSGR